ncbi:hypothetical protein EDF51_101191 [Curtobacterium sp. PhB25]|uniref:hypothetical protein n=1 Tax=unclassified Curtobacterium TaxID=257496 RepID=UPI001050CCBF|nr:MULTISPECIES: hypothetical protein [unclassified Curtobacterium]TCU85890.1 hypothetical protein EDF48_103193 [Curtobacterium sp. PhB191]TDW45723.1 hypothetical protein EDF52_109100 [Curtobacterium sp. PhB42]TDW57865.1 hypothetical protein EDF47_101100 [Curtobacterium sp. PhB190]TDW74185.1 hypothetical protein EDF51_101191 [Curtobacterium sp. PhB25]
MPRSTPAPWRSVDRRTTTLAALTLVAFGAAALARVLVDATTASIGSSTRYVTVPAAQWDTFDTANAIAGVGACCAGAGVLLFGATLVVAVRRHRAARLPRLLAAVTLTMVVGAVLAGIAAGAQDDFAAAAGWTIVRTALAGLAAASLPALCLAALRTRAARLR